MNIKLKQKINIIKISLFCFMFVFLIIPAISHGQYYVIGGDIPNTGDDELEPAIEMPENVNTPQQAIEDTISVSTIEEGTTTEPEQLTVEESVAENKKAFQTAGLLGTISGVVLALATTAIPLFSTTPTMIQDLLFLNLFGFMSKRKNERRWGVVFDADTKMPILAAKIVLFDSQMKELETTYSDKEGRFGFLAGEGAYDLDVYKKNYELYTESNRDEVYGDVYTGGEISVSGNKVLGINVALHSTTVNWQEYAEKKAKQYTSTWSLVKKYLFTSLYFIGFTATVVITIFYPSVINILLVIINTIFFIFIYFIKKKDHGTVMTTKKAPVPFAVVNLYDQEGSKDAFAVTDVIGRYYMLANNGQYTMKTSGQTLGNQSQSLEHDVHVRDGLVDKDIVFQ